MFLMMFNPMVWAVAEISTTRRSSQSLDAYFPSFSHLAMQTRACEPPQTGCDGHSAPWLGMSS